MSQKARNDWIRTTFQALPRFFELAGRMQPSVHLPDIRALDAEFLRTHSVRGLIWDVDGTLMPHHHLEIDPALRDTFDRLLSRDDLRHVILSNCGEERLAELGRIFPEVPVVKAYVGPPGPVARRLAGGQEAWLDLEGRPVASEGLTPVKKPSALPIRLALREMGDPPPEQVYMVGDQYFTDIAGANLGGVRSVKVPTWKRASFPLVLRTFQRLEGALFRVLHRSARA
jgi:HAD superfamily phosphatase (TIGR01668 family)